MINSEPKLDHIIRRMAGDRSENAPADAIKYAKDLYRTRLAQTQPSMLRRILAVLQADLAPNKAAFGERSVAGGQARQMLFGAGDNAIDLRIKTSGEKFHIRGLILGSGFDGGEAKLTGADLSISSQIDANGGFTFAGLESGEYSLTIQSKEIEISIEKFTL